MGADSAAVRCRGVRGATFIDEDTPEAILAGTRELLAAIARANVPLLGATEVDKPGAPPCCIRVLLHWNTSRRQDEVVHVYLRGSDVMRAQDPPSHLASGAHAEGPGA